MKPATELMWLDIAEVRTCDWNYKVPGTEAQMETLKNSISRDKSSGVLPVRVVETEDERFFEVIDGNHRLEALRELGWAKVPVENFGDISKADAITIARRRNEEWFDDDPAKYAALLRDEVLTKYSMEELEKFMPESLQQMEAMIESLDFNFDSYGTDAQGDYVDTTRILVVCKELDEADVKNAIEEAISGFEGAQIK